MMTSSITDDKPNFKEKWKYTDPLQLYNTYDVKWPDQDTIDVLLVKMHNIQ